MLQGRPYARHVCQVGLSGGRRVSGHPLDKARGTHMSPPRRGAELCGGCTLEEGEGWPKPQPINNQHHVKEQYLSIEGARR